MAARSSEFDSLRSSCWEQAIHCYGTSYIFGRRAECLRRRLSWLAFLGMAVPALVGVCVLTFSFDWWFLKVLVPILSVVGIVQFVLSLWALVARWQERHAYSVESKAANELLYEKYSALAKNPATLAEARVRLDLVEQDARVWRDKDSREGITDNEKRRGMRAGLRQVGRRCAGCDQVPVDMAPSDCGVCGKF